MIRLKWFKLDTWITAFLRDVKTRGLSDFTYLFYQRELNFFDKFCAEKDVSEVTQIDPVLLRDYLEWLEKIRKRPQKR
ncbi:MAG: site-specific integrase [Chloroflexi bacterium]|nr:site-specific integrase [Chloroflexota bacterium]